MDKQLPKPFNLLQKNINEITTEVEAVATYYPGSVRLYIPNRPMHKVAPGWETDREIKATQGTDKTSNESNLERSIRRSQRMVNDIVLCNQFELFATITIGKERQDPMRSKAKVHNWLKNQRRLNGKFHYILVPEYHKDGALHFHALVKGFTGELRRSINSKTSKPLMHNGKAVYEFASYTSGFTKVQYVGSSDADHQKVGGYIRKYITKDMVTIFNQKRYWSSQGLKKPYREDNPEKWYEAIKPSTIYENEYGKILTFSLGENPVVDWYIEARSGAVK